MTTAGWTRERVLQLAPDGSSAKAGEGLASPRKWVRVGGDEGALWGECQGSGAKPYQVQIDVSEPAFKCSCPSRKFPCKHGVGLLLMAVTSPEVIEVRPRPAWVEEWFKGRQDRAEKKAKKAQEAPKPVDAEAQAERAAKRLARIGEGLRSLAVWAQDWVRQGIAAAPGKGYGFFDEPARRMIDAQAPGAGRMVQELAAIASSGGGWEKPFLARLGSIHLLARAFERMEQLPPATREDVLATAGVAKKEEEVLAGPAVKDRWQVVGQEVEVEERLRVQRTWLFGAATARAALVLQFAHGTAALDASLAVGMEFEGEVCFFPGNGVRAGVKRRGAITPIAALAGMESLEALCAAYGAMLARQPWLGAVGMPIRAVVPVREGGRWRIVDAAGDAMEAAMSEDAAWVAAALSGGGAIDVVAEFDGERLRPVAFVAEGEFVSITRGGGEAEGGANA